MFSAAAVTAAVGEIGWLFGGCWVLGGRVAGQFLKLVAMGRTTKWAAATPLGPVARAFFMHPHIHSCWAGFLRFYFFFFGETSPHPQPCTIRCRSMQNFVAFDWLFRALVVKVINGV